MVWKFGTPPAAIRALHGAFRETWLLTHQSTLVLMARLRRSFCPAKAPFCKRWKESNALNYLPQITAWCYSPASMRQDAAWRPCVTRAALKFGIASRVHL